MALLIGSSGGGLSVRQICDALGIDVQTQLAKLKEKPWATGWGAPIGSRELIGGGRG